MFRIDSNMLSLYMREKLVRNGLYMFRINSNMLSLYMLEKLDQFEYVKLIHG